MSGNEIRSLTVEEIEAIEAKLVPVFETHDQRKRAANIRSLYSPTQNSVYFQILTLIFSPYIRCIFKIPSQIGA